MQKVPFHGISYNYVVIGILDEHPYEAFPYKILLHQVLCGISQETDTNKIPPHFISPQNIFLG